MKVKKTCHPYFSPKSRCRHTAKWLVVEIITWIFKQSFVKIHSVVEKRAHDRLCSYSIHCRSKLNAVLWHLHERLLISDASTNFWNGQIISNLFNCFSLSIPNIIETPYFSILKYIAKHNNTLYFFFDQHSLIILLSTFQRSLSNNDFLVIG